MAIHFRGHGLRGGLLFENALGFAEALRRRLATVLLSPRRAGSFPGLFFLAAPYTAREVPASQDTAISVFDQESSATAALHCGCFAQVVDYFGPASADLTTRLARLTFGPRSPDVTQILNMLWQLRILLGNPDTQKTSREALELPVEVFGPNHPTSREVRDLQR
jgi:hypothetical protein